VRGWEHHRRAGVAGNPVSIFELDVNYRTPKEIMDLAWRCWNASEPHSKHPRSVRSTDHRPEAIGRGRARHRTASPTPTRRVGRGASPSSVRAKALPRFSPRAIDERVVEIGLDDARGLEFDHVIVSEPATQCR